MFFFTCSITKTTSPFIPLLTVASVSARGYISQILINGTAYVGNAPQANPVPSVIRQTSSVSPIYAVYSPDMTCGNGSPKPASLMADVSPGDLLNVTWLAGGDTGIGEVNVRFH